MAYIYGNTVRKENKYIYRIRREYNYKDQSKCLSFRQFFICGLLIFSLFFSAGIVLKIQSDISSCQRRISVLESEYDNLVMENNDRLVCLESKINICDIKEKAYELGMKVATDEQVILVD